ncbi:hypothetical protein SD71_10925 [Cohnella kolymensis]|uniref:DUF5666 domain-containing protein n=1 Tax=Cohnella kolymensis TaxID=1590652 RepID=A0ABR5A4B9_9BACL|nr:hypothetical protein [Cohnella kolymensis]KIL35891.1 hypothetical protein SD71_10925 [Cohnella kolymensis]
MNTNKKTIMALSTAVLALALTACSGDNVKSSPSPSASASPTTSASPTASASAAVESPSASPSASQEAKITDGEFVGVSDTHTIEIKTEEGATSFQVSPEIVEKVTPWEEGTKVQFQFTEETLDVDGQQVKQRTITTIDKQ